MPLLKLQAKIANCVSGLGLLLQNYEADKEALLEEIERKQSRVSKQVEELNMKYGLPEGQEYQLLLPQNNPVKAGEAAFIKTEVLNNE